LVLSRIIIKNDAFYDKSIPRPDLRQIQNFKRYVNSGSNTNEIGPVKDYLSKITYDRNKQINQNEAIEFDSKVRTGSENNKLFIFLTSITVMMFMKIINIPYHIDWTYNICERGFKLIVFGLSDLAGQFFPIAFAIVSHEQEVDFKLFFQTLLLLCQHMNFVPNINYLIQESCGASANAASKCLGPNIKILMCFFHVQKNVRERLKGCDEIVKTGIIKDINYLHFCRND
jgi:hypothetical protein